MGLFWPSKEREQSALWAKLACLVHWVCVSIAIVMLPGLLSDFIDGWVQLRFLLISLSIATVGRDLRFLIARE